VTGYTSQAPGFTPGILVVHPWYFGGSSLVFWWFTPGILVVHAWYFGGSPLVFWWFMPGILVVHPWYFGGSCLVFWWGCVGHVAHLFSFLCCVFLFVCILCLVTNIACLDCPSCFSNVYIDNSKTMIDFSKS
jgi:hypothetical protein